MNTELNKLVALEDIQQEAYDTVRSRVEYDGENPDNDKEVQELFAQLIETQDKIAAL
jgi:hypothetical protein